MKNLKAIVVPWLLTSIIFFAVVGGIIYFTQCKMDMELQGKLFDLTDKGKCVGGTFDCFFFIIPVKEKDNLYRINLHIWPADEDGYYETSAVFDHLPTIQERNKAIKKLEEELGIELIIYPKDI